MGHGCQVALACGLVRGWVVLGTHEWQGWVSGVGVSLWVCVGAMVLGGLEWELDAEGGSE